MRLRFPELKDATDSLKQLLDIEFLEGKWGNSDTDYKGSHSLDAKHSARPSINLIRKYGAYSPFIDDHFESTFTPAKLTLRKFLTEIFKNNSLKKKLI